MYTFYCHDLLIFLYIFYFIYFDPFFDIEYQFLTCMPFLKADPTQVNKISRNYLNPTYFNFIKTINIKTN